MSRFLLNAIFIPLLYLTQCKKQEAVSGYVPATIITTDTAGSKRFLALGDSYTIGQSVGAYERFPAQTVSLLRSMGIRINDPFYIAATGWTTNDLANSITNSYTEKKYDVVTLLIGVNDQYQTHDTSGYRSRFAGLLNKAITFAQGIHEHVVVLSIPDYSVTPFAQNSDTTEIRREIDLFNAINKEVTDEQNCKYLNITPFTREARYDNTLIASDGLHPSGKEYAVWAQPLSQIMYPFLK
ncbi:MAG: SGNH/GDSL hydrolase family protein [Ferruginibacter sp.]